MNRSWSAIGFRVWRIRIAVAGLGLVLVLWGFFPGGPVLAGPGRDFDPARMEAFFEGLIQGQLKAFHSPGAALVMVKSGEVVLSKGWGRADPAQGTPFDPDRSVFLAGSLSKLVTDMAILQLREKGLLDLEADVRTYLGDFDLRLKFPEPLTLTHLMTHTSGFEFRVDGPQGRSLSLAGLAAALAASVLIIRAWRDRSGRIGLRILYSLAALSLVLFTLWPAYWRMF